MASRLGGRRSSGAVAWRGGERHPLGDARHLGDSAFHMVILAQQTNMRECTIRQCALHVNMSIRIKSVQNRGTLCRQVDSDVRK